MVPRVEQDSLRRESSLDNSDDTDVNGSGGASQQLLETHDDSAPYTLPPFSLSPAASSNNDAFLLNLSAADWSDSFTRSASSQATVDGLRRTHRRAASHSVRRSVFKLTPVTDSPHSESELHLEAKLRRGTRTYLDVEKSSAIGRASNASVEYDVRRQFLVRLTEALTRFGAPPYRIEHLLEMASITLGVTATFAILPNLIVMTYEDPVHFETETILLTIRQGYDLGRLQRTNALCRRLAVQDITLEEATSEIERLLDPRQTTWSMRTMAVSNIFASAFMVPLYFHGSWADAVFAAVLSALVRGIELLAERFTSLTYIYTVLAAITASFFGVMFRSILASPAVQHYMPGVALCFQADVLGAMLNEMPGLMLCTSFVELTSTHVISGTVRLASGTVTALSLAFGLSAGYRMYGALQPAAVVDIFQDCSGPGMWPVDSTSGAYWPLVACFLVFGTALCMCIGLRASPRQFPLMFFNTFLSFWVGTWLDQAGFQGETVSVMTAFCCGIVSNTYSRFTGDPGIPSLLAGVIMLVPGSLGVRSSLQLIDSQDYPSGTSFAFRVLLIALSLALGILGSRIVPPIDSVLKRGRVKTLRRREQQRRQTPASAAAPSASTASPSNTQALRYLHKLTKWMMRAEMKRTAGQQPVEEMGKVNKWLKRWESTHSTDAVYHRMEPRTPRQDQQYP
ncbi:pheromone-regulated protein prm10 [Sorochytrium milnesiophthora]